MKGGFSMEKPKIKKANKRALIILALLIAARVGLSAVFVMTAKAEINSNGFINYNGRSYSEAPSRLSYDVMIDYNGARKNRSRLYNGTAWDFSLNPIYMKFVSPLNPQLDKNSSFLITDIGESSQKIYIANDFVLPAVDYDTVESIWLRFYDNSEKLEDEQSLRLLISAVRNLEEIDFSEELKSFFGDADENYCYFKLKDLPVFIAYKISKTADGKYTVSRGRSRLQ